MSTPWLLMCTCSAVGPHFLMELHVGLSAAVPNATWVDYIPQLEDITTSRMALDNGYALPPEAPGLGIAWDWKAIHARQSVNLEITT